MVAIDGPRLVLSLSSFSAGAAVFVLFALLVAAYWIGQASGLDQGLAQGFKNGQESIQATALDDIEAARVSQPSRELFAGMPSSPVRAEPALPENAKRSGLTGPAAEEQVKQPALVRGHTYIVVQEFLAEDRASAESARQFLQERGVPTIIVPSKGNRSYKYHLVTQKGFNCDDPAQKERCNEYHEKIRKLGDLFKQAGGRYDLQGYQKKATADRS